MTGRRRVVDIHSHLYPRWYIDMLKERNEIPMVRGGEGEERFVIFADEQAQGSGGGRGMTPDYWSIEAKLAFMDRHGIEKTVLSLGNPWFDPFTPEESLAAARRLNDDFATLAERTAGRVVGMGALPGGDVEAVVRVIGEIAERVELSGAVAGTHIANHTFDDPRLDPAWEALERTGVPLFIHPHGGSAMDELRGFGHALPVAVAFPMETTIALVRLVMAGVLHRYPGLRLVAAHGGGTLPYLAGRLDAGWRSDASLASRAPTPPSEVLHRLFLDAVLYHPRALLAATDLVGPEHLAFGTDHPFSIADPEANLSAIDTAFGDRAGQVLADTAEALYVRR